MDTFAMHISKNYSLYIIELVGKNDYNLVVVSIYGIPPQLA